MSSERELSALFRKPMGPAVDIGEAAKEFNARIEGVERSLSALPWKVECSVWKDKEHGLSFARADRGWLLKVVTPKQLSSAEASMFQAQKAFGAATQAPVVETPLRDASIEAKVRAIALIPDLLQQMRRTYVARRRLLSEGNLLLDRLQDAIAVTALDIGEGE